MGIEAELKTRVHDTDRVRRLLRQRAVEQNSVHADSYFDTPDRTLTHDGCELRVREVHTDDVAVTLLTYKGARCTRPADPNRKPRQPPVTPTRFGLSSPRWGSKCSSPSRSAAPNYRFTAAGQTLLATLVYVPELEESFLEIETIVDSEAEVGPALEAVRQVLGELELDRNDETTEAYTEAVAARRNKP